MSEENNSVLNPKISVIIPVFNAEQYLRQCLDSVLSQSLRDIEVICVDDGSTDSSLAILNEYKERDTRIKVIHQENLHAGVARNNGLKQARGEYIHFLDADDWIEKDVYYQWYAIAKDKNADVCKCQHGYYDEKTKVITRKAYDREEYITVNSIKLSPRDLIACDVVPWNRLYKRVFLIDNNIFFDDLVITNDRYFYFHAIVKAKRIVTVKEWWVTYRVNNDKSLNGEIRLQNYDCLFKSFFKIWDVVKDCDEGTKQLTFQASVNGFFALYQKAKGTVYEDNIRKQLCDFLTEWDISSIVNGFKYADDYKDIIKNSREAPIFILVSKYYEKLIADKHSNLQDIQKKHRQVLKEHKQIAGSRSYRLGRFLSFPYRKAKGGIKCYKEYGTIYTLKRCWQKITGV